VTEGGWIALQKVISCNKIREKRSRWSRIPIALKKKGVDMLRKESVKGWSITVRAQPPIPRTEMTPKKEEKTYKGIGLVNGRRLKMKDDCDTSVRAKTEEGRE